MIPVSVKQRQSSWGILDGNADKDPMGSSCRAGWCPARVNTTAILLLPRHPKQPHGLAQGEFRSEGILTPLLFPRAAVAALHLQPSDGREELLRESIWDLLG